MTTVDKEALETSIDRLLCQMSRAHEATEVAVAVGPRLAVFVPNDADRLLVVSDIVRQWHRLPGSEQAPYKALDTYSPVARFGVTYADSLSYEAFADRMPEAYNTFGAEANEVQYWQQFVAALRDLAGGQQIQHQIILIGHDEAAVPRTATGDERQRFNLAPGGSVIEVRRPGGGTELYGCRQFSLKDVTTTSSRRAAQ